MFWKSRALMFIKNFLVFQLLCHFYATPSGVSQNKYTHQRSNMIVTRIRMYITTRHTLDIEACKLTLQFFFFFIFLLVYMLHFLIKFSNFNRYKNLKAFSLKRDKGRGRSPALTIINLSGLNVI